MEIGPKHTLPFCFHELMIKVKRTKSYKSPLILIVWWCWFDIAVYKALSTSLCLSYSLDQSLYFSTSFFLMFFPILIAKRKRFWFDKRSIFSLLLYDFLVWGFIWLSFEISEKIDAKTKKKICYKHIKHNLSHTHKHNKLTLIFFRKLLSLSNYARLSVVLCIAPTQWIRRWWTSF